MHYFLSYYLVSYLNFYVLYVSYLIVYLLCIILLSEKTHLTKTTFVNIYQGLQIGLSEGPPSLVKCSKFHLISSSWEFKPMSIRSKMKKKIPLALMGDSGWDKISHLLSTWDVSGLFSPKPHDSWFYILSPVTGNVFLWKKITHFLHSLWQEMFDCNQNFLAVTGNLFLLQKKTIL